MAYPVSDAFRNKEYSGESEFKGRLIIGNTTVPNEQLSKITIEDYILDSSSSENNGVFYIGTFIAQKVTVKFKNLDGIELHSGDDASLFISQYVGNEWVEIPMGVYHVDELAKNYYETCEIDLLDYSTNFRQNIDYSPCFVDGKATIDTILQYICTTCGVTLGTYPTINGNEEIGQFDSEVSGKRWISYIAELKGSNAKIGRDGQLYLIPLKHEHTVSINALQSASWKLGEKYEISRVRFDNGVILYEKGDTTENTLYLRQDNPFILSQEAVDNIYESLLTSGEEETEEGNIIDLNLVDDLNLGKFTLFGNTSQGTTILPSGYQQVEYIEKDGSTQYIDTLLKGNLETKIILKCNKVTASTQKVITVAGENTNTQKAITINLPSTNGNARNQRFGNKVVSYSSQLETNVDYEIMIDKRGTFVNGSQILTFNTTTTFDTEGNIYLFKCNGINNDYADGQTRIYYCKIYKNNNLVRNFIPCYKTSNNEIGFYDLVNNVFYTNSGTGSFGKGGDVALPNPNYPQKINVVSGNNTINIVGKNMYNYIDSFVASMNGLTNTLNDDGSITTTGIPTANYRIINNSIAITDLLEDGQKYTISQKNANTYLYIQINLVRRDGGATEYIGTKNSRTYTFTVNKSVYSTYSIRIQTTSTSEWGSSSRTITNFYQLEKGEQGTDFEKYTVHKHNIDLPVENILPTDKNAWEQGTISASTGENQESVTRLRTIDYYPIKSDTDYFVSLKASGYVIVNILMYDASKTFVGAYNSYSSMGQRTKQVNILSSFFSNVSYIRVTIRKSDNVSTITTDEIDTIKPQIEYGTKENNWCPYGTEAIELCEIGDYKDNIYYQSSSRNLLDVSLNTNNYYISQSGVPTSLNGHNYTELMPVTTGKYTFSGIQNKLNATNTKRIHGYDANGDWVKQITSFGVTTTTEPVNYSQAFTLSDENIKYIRLSYYNNDTYCQFERGDTATEYQPYGSGWFIKKEINKSLLNNITGGSLEERGFRSSLTLAKPYEAYPLLYCDYFRRAKNYNEAVSINNTTPNMLGLNSSGVVLCNVAGYTTKQQYLDFFSNNNIYVYYPLLTPTYTKVTDTTLLGELNALQDVALYKGVNHISQTNNDLPSYLRLDYAGQNQFEMYSLETKNYGDISLDAWDLIDYELGNDTYTTYNNRKLTFEMSIMSETNVQISNKQQEETTNMIGGSTATQTRKLKTTVNALDNKITLEAEQLETSLDAQEGRISSLEISANGLSTTVSSLQSYTNEELDKLNIDFNNYKTLTDGELDEVNSKFGNYATKNDLITIQNSVNTITDDTYTKTEVNTLLVDGSVKKLQTTSATLDENGMTYAKTNAPTTSTINERGLTIRDSSDNPVLRAVYDDDIKNSVVETYRHQVHEYFIMGNHSRFEDYEDGTGCFYID